MKVLKLIANNCIDCLFVAFSVDSGGIVTSQMVLDRESINNYTLIITATDGGAQPRSATANVTILINDENDNSPRFISGAVLSSDPVMIPEVRRI